MAVLNGLLLVSVLTVAFLFRGNTYVLSLSTTAAGIILSALYTSVRKMDKTTFWAVIKAGTAYHRSTVRVSLAYLISVRIDDRYLLVRGKRIRTQYQPVGGVYKSRLRPEELYARFRAESDTRFKPDATNQDDLRLRLPGGRLGKLLHWFNRGEGREYLPTREFYEELVHTALLDEKVFDVIDCQPVARRAFPLRYDRWARCQQLIVADIWVLHPTPEQEAELRKLSARKPRSRDVYFASQEEILSGGKSKISSTTFDIAPTSEWILEAGK